MSTVAAAANSFLVEPSLTLFGWSLAVTAGGMLTAAKSRWEWLVIGLFTGGLIWPLTAFLLARPDSVWARRVYGDAKRDRARRTFGSGLRPANE